MAEAGMSVEHFKCLCCTSGDAAPFLTGVPDCYLATGFRMDYAKCEHCGLVQQHPLPADVGPFYAAYPVHASKSWLHEFTRRIVLRPVYFDLNRLTRDMQLLDYGCGDGWFLDHARSRVAKAVGYEPTGDLAKIVSGRVGLPVYHRPDEMRAELGGKIDVATMHFVMEHLTDLDGTLALVADVLKPGGLLYAVLPNIQSREFRMFGGRWHGFDAPRHISFPDERQLGPVLQRHGLVVEQTTFVPFPNTMAASLCIRWTGKYRHPLFLACMPFAFLWARIFPDGTRCLTIRKNK